MIVLEANYAKKLGLTAYGDCTARYIGTEIACTQGGYEVQASNSNTAEFGKVLIESMQKLLQEP